MTSSRCTNGWDQAQSEQLHFGDCLVGDRILRVISVMATTLRSFPRRGLGGGMIHPGGPRLTPTKSTEQPAGAGCVITARITVATDASAAKIEHSMRAHRVSCLRFFPVQSPSSLREIVEPAYENHRHSNILP